MLKVKVQIAYRKEMSPESYYSCMNELNALRETQLTLPQNVDQFYPGLLATVKQNYFHVADPADILAWVRYIMNVLVVFLM